MLLANIAYLINIIALVGYFVWWPKHTVWPEEVIAWTWLPFFIHVCYHHYADGVQNTTRNIARIYLLKYHGSNYDDNLVVPIQHALIPDSMFKTTIMWQLAHVSSFIILLFYQGWGTALCAEIGLILFAGVLPINYQSHLWRIYGSTKKMDFRNVMALLSVGVFVDKLTSIVHQAAKERKNPQKWWAIVLRETLIAEKESPTCASSGTPEAGRP